MKLSSMHQLLIAMAMGLAAIFALRACYFAISHGEMSQAVLALVSAVAVGLLWRYLRRFRAKLALAASSADPGDDAARDQATRAEQAAKADQATPPEETDA